MIFKKNVSWHCSVERKLLGRKMRNIRTVLAVVLTIGFPFSSTVVGAKVEFSFTNSQPNSELLFNNGDKKTKSKKIKLLTDGRSSNPRASDTITN